MTSESSFYTVEEFARTARISRVTVHRLIKAGRLPSCTIGRRRLIPADALRVERKAAD